MAHRYNQSWILPDKEYEPLFLKDDATDREAYKVQQEIKRLGLESVISEAEEDDPGLPEDYDIAWEVDDGNLFTAETFISDVLYPVCQPVLLSYKKEMDEKGFGVKAEKDLLQKAVYYICIYCIRRYSETSSSKLLQDMWDTEELGINGSLMAEYNLEEEDLEWPNFEDLSDDIPALRKAYRITEDFIKNITRICVDKLQEEVRGLSKYTD